MPKDQAQRDLAVNLRNKNILVSAGAGSGKTRTMTNRIVHLIKDCGVDVSNILVLTFTNAAAKEMRDRIIKALRNAGLIEQAIKAQSADICTFDAFSLKVVKKYGYKVGLEKGVTNADEAVIELEATKIIKEIYDELLINNDNRFIKLLETYPDKDASSITKFIINIMNKAALAPDEAAYYDSYKEFYTNNFKQDLKDKYIKSVLQAKEFYINALITLIDKLDDANEKLSDYCDDLVSKLGRAKTVSEIKTVLADIKIPSLVKGTPVEVSKLKGEAKDALDNLSDKLDIDIDKEIDDYFKKKEEAEIIFEIAKKTYLRLKSFKEEHSYFTFADIAKYAIEIVDRFSDVRDELKNKYEEVCLDEYQDVSDLQEHFVNAIAHQNVYQCGDIKQSIYGFRNANPDLFMEKYRTYKRPSPTECESDNVLLELTENFRSHEETIQDFNRLFDYALTEKVGGADYKRSHRMNFGQDGYKLNPSKSSHHMKLVGIHNDCEMKAVEYNRTLDLAEVFFIVKDIKEKMENNLVFDIENYDKDKSKEENIKNCVRKPMFKDFAILARDATHFNEIKKILESEGIPALIHKPSDLSQSYVVANMLSTLEVLFLLANNLEKTDEYKDKFLLSLVSMLRGYTLEYTDDKIFNLVKTGDIYQELDNLGFIKLAKKSQTMGIADFIDEVLELLKSYSKVYKHSEVLKIDEEIKAIKTKLTDLVMLGNKDYEAVNMIIDALNEDSSVEFETPIDDAADMVRIMTIHKSKGLEFSYVYLPFINKHFNDADKRQAFIYDNELGLIMPTIEDHLKTKSGFREILFEIMDEKRLSEEARLLYVALTRAKDNFTLLFDSENARMLCMNSLYTILHNSVPSKEVYLFCEDVPISSIHINDKYIYGTVRPVTFGKEKIKVTDLVLPEKVKHQHASGEVSEIMSDKVRKNIELGLHLHGWLEALDLENPNFDLIKDSFIRNKCKKVLSLEPFKNHKSEDFYQEHEFYDEVSNTHGIIDLFIVSSDHIDLIDYKLAHTDKETYRDQLRVYKQYLTANYPGKTINVYLLSLIEEKLVEIAI